MFWQTLSLPRTHWRGDLILLLLNIYDLGGVLRYIVGLSWVQTRPMTWPEFLGGQIGQEFFWTLIGSKQNSFDLRPGSSQNRVWDPTQSKNMGSALTQPHCIGLQHSSADTSSFFMRHMLTNNRGIERAKPRVQPDQTISA